MSTPDVRIVFRDGTTIEMEMPGADMVAGYIDPGIADEFANAVRDVHALNLDTVAKMNEKGNCSSKIIPAKLSPTCTNAFLVPSNLLRRTWQRLRL